MILNHGFLFACLNMMHYHNDLVELMLVKVMQAVYSGGSLRRK